jgi:quercetin dioxygenase-like cupin family protein
MNRMLATIALCFGLMPGAFGADEHDLSTRHEVKRADLSGAPNMEVITSIAEVAAGQEVPRHSHHGLESLYVLQGSMVQFPGKEPQMLATGTTIFSLRDVPHGGFKVVGESALKLLVVHVVDKGKPLFEWVK